MAPLLFLFYVNNLAETLPNDVVTALFADGVSILTTARKKEDVVTAAQSEVTKVYEWGWTWKLNLNADKSECCPFSSWSNDNKWCPSLTIGGQQIRVNEIPRLLGVFLDCSLLFNAHIKYIKQSFIIKTPSYYSYSTCFLGLGETFTPNCFPCLGLLQARICQTSMATLALQHQHHQFGSSPKSGSTFDNWATSFYSARSPSSQVRRTKLLHRKQIYDCLRQGEISPYYSWPSKRTCSTKRHSSTHFHLLQLLPQSYWTFDDPSRGNQPSPSRQFVPIS